MKTRYSPEADALYVSFRSGAVDYTEPVGDDDNRLVDYDGDGRPLGIEILDASKGIDLTGLPESGRVAKAAARFSLPISSPA